MKDINGKTIKIGMSVKTQQIPGGILNPAPPSIGIVEKADDLYFNIFGEQPLQIRFRKEGKNYDTLIIINGQINEIIEN